LYTARIEVLMGKGPRPEGADVYGADDVISSIRARMEVQTPET
jgi:hypothetical protein